MTVINQSFQIRIFIFIFLARSESTCADLLVSVPSSCTQDTPNSVCMLLILLPPLIKDGPVAGDAEAHC